MTKDEEIIYGYQACLAISKKRPASVVKLYLTKERVSEFGSLTRLMAAERKAFNVVSSDELETLTHTPHHGGVSLVAKKRPALSLSDWLRTVEADSLSIALVGVSNPHNLGAIARSMAHFGVMDLILVDPVSGALSAPAYRIAEGGLEYLRIFSTSARDFLALKDFKLYAPSPHQGVELEHFNPESSSILMFGSEEHGLDERFLKRADELVTIKGAGLIESLNVSVAAGIFLNHLRALRSSIIR